MPNSALKWGWLLCQSVRDEPRSGSCLRAQGCPKATLGHVQFFKFAATPNGVASPFVFDRLTQRSRQNAATLGWRTKPLRGFRCDQA